MLCTNSSKMHDTNHSSSLLPDVFRYKSSKIRVLQPQVILMDFHGTIIERRWEDKVIFPYVKRAVNRFLRDNWDDDTVQRCLPGLRNESFEQRFRNKYEDAPIISDHIDGEEADQEQLADQVGDFIVWQMNSRKETRETQTIERLVWQDGFRRKQISLPLYEDVTPCIKAWREKHHCSIYIISSVDVETLKLLFENAEKGNVDQYVTGYISPPKIGEKVMTETYRQFYEKVQNNGHRPRKASPASQIQKSPPSSANLSKTSPPNGNLKQLSRTSSPVAKPILFLTDSGQEAKAASQVADGLGFECVLINRPGNKRIRAYYLSHFQIIDSFSDIEFVP